MRAYCIKWRRQKDSNFRTVLSAYSLSKRAPYNLLGISPYVPHQAALVTSLGRCDTAYIVRRVKALVVARPERVGFEPTEVLPSPVFKTGVLNQTLPSLHIILCDSRLDYHNSTGH